MSGDDRIVSTSRLRAVLGTELGRLRLVLRRPPATWVGAIETSGLPLPVAERIGEIVGRTRLWSGEKLDVARELIAHARDAIEGGGEPGEVASALGEAGVVAPLIRRGMRRKRHWTWHARAWVVRGVGVSAGVVVVAAGVFAARFFAGTPSPTRDFIAEMNAPFEKYGEDERSWGLLREANIAILTAGRRVRDGMMKRADGVEIGSLTDEQRRLKVERAGVHLIHGTGPGHPDYGAMVALLEELQPALELSREAASRPVVGMRFSTRSPDGIDYSSMPEGWYPDPLPEPDDPAEQDLLLGVLLPAMNAVRMQSRWLAFDALVAARGGGGDRVVADIGAILGFAEQVDRDGVLISNLVALACTDLARRTLGQVMHEHPGLLGRGELVEMAHRLGRVRTRFERLPLEWEMRVFEDVLQRTYTDDGGGDGYLTSEGVRILQTLGSLAGGDGPFETVVDYAAFAASSSRAEQRRVYKHALSLLREDEAAGYEIFRGRGLEVDRWVERELDKPKHRLVAMLLPSHGRALAAQARGRAQIDGTLLAIAATLHRMDTGTRVSDIESLVPRYLPSVPEDPFTGGALRLVVDDDGVVVYSTGPDGRDDGGLRGTSMMNNWTRRDRQREDEPGDWVLHPPE